MMSIKVFAQSWGCRLWSEPKVWQAVRRLSRQSSLHPRVPIKARVTKAGLTISRALRAADGIFLTLFLVLATMHWSPTVAETPDAVADAFARPPELEPDIRFWERIYASVTTQGGLVHDDRHLGVIYEQIDFSASVDPHTRLTAIEATRAKYQRILTELADGGDLPLSEEHQRVLALWPVGVSADVLRDAASHVRFQLGQADRFREGLVRSGAWESHITEVLHREGVSAELVALPHVESSFNPLARSKVGAAGMWQFMPSTAAHALTMDPLVDERLDPYQSTAAAAKFLAHAHQILGSWPLAVTAYNHGISGMMRAKASLGTDDIATIVRNYQSPSFGFASRNFYVSFLAALTIARHYDRYFGSLDRLPRDTSHPIRLPQYVPVRALERISGVDRTVLRQLNLSLLDPVWHEERFVPKGYEFRVPASAGDPQQVLSRLSNQDLYAQQRVDPIYRVARHETLSSVAHRFGTTSKELLALNNLPSPKAVKAGMALRLPEPKPIGSLNESAVDRAPKNSHHEVDH